MLHFCAGLWGFWMQLLEEYYQTRDPLSRRASATQAAGKKPAAHPLARKTIQVAGKTFSLLSSQLYPCLRVWVVVTDTERQCHALAHATLKHSDTQGCIPCLSVLCADLQRHLRDVHVETALHRRTCARCSSSDAHYSHNHNGITL